jgi:hypothetical protein
MADYNNPYKNKLKQVGEGYDKFVNEPILPESFDLSQLQFLKPNVQPKTPIAPPETQGENQGYQQRMDDIRRKGVEQEQAGRDPYRDMKTRDEQNQQEMTDLDAQAQFEEDPQQKAILQQRFLKLKQMMGK